MFAGWTAAYALWKRTPRPTSRNLSPQASTEFHAIVEPTATISAATSFRIVRLPFAAKHTALQPTTFLGKTLDSSVSHARRRATTGGATASTEAARRVRRGARCRIGRAQS